MTKALDYRTRLRIIKSYVTGMGINEIARKLELSSSTVSELINNFKSGSFIVFENPEAGPLSSEITDIVKYCKENNIGIEKLPDLVFSGILLSDFGLDKESVVKYLDMLKKQDRPEQFVDTSIQIQNVLESDKMTIKELFEAVKSKTAALSKAQSNLDSINVKIGSLTTEKKTLSSEISNRKGELSKYEEQLDLAKAVKNIVGSNSKAKILTLLNALSQQNFDAARIIALNSLQEKLDKGKVSVEEVINRAEELEFLKSIGLTKNAVRTLKLKSGGSKTIEELLNEFAEYLNKPAQLEQEFEQKKQEYDTELREYVSQIREQKANEYDKLQKEYAHKEHILAETYNEQEKEVINIIRDKRKEIEELEKTIASLNKDIEEVKKADAKVNSDFESDMHFKAALDDKITELKAKISVLETKDSNYAKMIDAKDQEIKDLDSEIIKISGIQSSVYDRNKVLDKINADISKANNNLNQVQTQQRNIMQSINDTQEKILTANMFVELIKTGTINLSSMNQLTKILGLKSFTNAGECRQYLIDQIIQNFSKELGPYISGYRIITRAEYQQYLNAKRELNALADSYASGSLTQNIDLKNLIDGILEQKYEPSILHLNRMVKDQTSYSVNDTVKSVSGDLLNSYKMLKTGMGYKDTGAIEYDTMCPFCKKITHVNINVTELYEKDTVNVTCESGHNFNIPSYEVLKGLIFPGANMVLANDRIFHTITITPHFKANDTNLKPQ